MWKFFTFLSKFSRKFAQKQQNTDQREQNKTLVENINPIKVFPGIHTRAGIFGKTRTEVAFLAERCDTVTGSRNKLTISQHAELLTLWHCNCCAPTKPQKPTKTHWFRDEILASVRAHWACLLMSGSYAWIDIEWASVREGRDGCERGVTEGQQ